MKNPYVPTAAGLYLNYLIHGMGVLLITLNMANLQGTVGNRRGRRLHRHFVARDWQARHDRHRIPVRPFWP